MFSAIYTNIEIDASVEKCWNAFFDFSQYPKWNTLVGQARGKLGTGQRLQLYLKTSSKLPVIYSTQVKNIQTNVEFRCLSVRGFPLIIDWEYVIQFESISKSRTLLRQWIYFSGLLVPFFVVFRKKQFSEEFIKMNAAFKHFLETK